ncbi:inosine/xanthosine triphosphatase [Archaeoglobus sp.]
MKVAVGSTNPTKVKGVKKAFEEFFEDVEVVSKDVDSGVSAQPIGGDVIKGAINRALNAYGDCDFSVGVEAGLFKFERTITGYVDFQVAVIYNGFKYSIGFGPGFEFPPFVVERALKGEEVGKIMSEFTGIKEIGRKIGAIHYLTRGKVSRIDLTRIAVTMALIPWLNEELYW